MTPEKFNILVEKWLVQQMTEEEMNEFLSAVATGKYQQLLSDALEKDLTAGSFGGLTTADQRKAAYERLLMQVKKEQPQLQPVSNSVSDHTSGNAPRLVHRLHFLKTSWFRYAAAIIIVLGAAAVVRVFTHRNDELATNQPSINQPSDIAPGTNRAILTIDNKKIDLASNKTGVTVNNTINYNDGSSIDGLASNAQLSTINYQLSTPRGGQYQAVLPDGTKVWLNAASSIKFPSKFDGNNREVTITGEAYLEVAKNTKQPFYVHTNKETIQVLGTSFNVNAYEDEEAEKTTLVEGSVRINSTFNIQHSTLLKPNQQAIIDNQGNHLIRLISGSDVIAWKSGLFNFNNASFDEMARQLERWYDIRVIYEGRKPGKSFEGKMDRGLSLSQVLKILNETGIHCRVEGRTVVVSE